MLLKDEWRPERYCASLLSWADGWATTTTHPSLCTLTVRRVSSTDISTGVGTRLQRTDAEPPSTTPSFLLYLDVHRIVYNSELSMGWVDPRVGLGWIEYDKCTTRWIKQAIHIRKEGQQAMNRDEGGYQLSHAYDRFLDTASSRCVKNRKNWVPASSDKGLW